MIYCALFTNFDSIVKVDEKVVNWAKKTKQKTGKILLDAFEKGGKEVLISEQEHKVLKKFGFNERRIGGNAGNASAALSQIGIPSILSCPVRPKELMNKLSRYSIKICDPDPKKPPKVIRKDPVFDHISFEFVENEKLGIKKSGRQIFTWDRMGEELWFDKDFWFYINKGVLYLSGFHLVLPKFKHKINLVADLLEEKKMKVHLELGEGTPMVKYALKKLRDKQCINSLGLNEMEMRFLGSNKRIEDLVMKDLDRMVVHTPEEVNILSKLNEKKSLEFSLRVAASKTYGRIDIKKIKKSPIKTKKFGGYTLYSAKTLFNPKPKIGTGLGDSFAAINAVLSLR